MYVYCVRLGRAQVPKCPIYLSPRHARTRRPENMLASAGLLIAAICLLFAGRARGFQHQRIYSSWSSSSVHYAREEDDNMSTTTVDEYRNGATAFLSNFMQKEPPTESDPISEIDFDAPKVKLSIDDLAAALDYELFNREWFVTGDINPIYFSDDFQFQDPDVKLTGVEEYARGVYKLFDQDTSRAEIISTVVDATVPNTITVTWRLSGGVSIGPGRCGCGSELLSNSLTFECRNLQG